MKQIHDANRRLSPAPRLASAVGALLLLALGHAAAPSGGEERIFERWLQPHDWRRDRDQPALSLGDKGNFDDQHIFALHVSFADS